MRVGVSHKALVLGSIISRPGLSKRQEEPLLWSKPGSIFAPGGLLQASALES